MTRLSSLAVILSLAFIISTSGCSQNNSIPTMTETTPDDPIVKMNSGTGRMMMGIWKIKVNIHDNTVKVEPYRTTMIHTKNPVDLTVTSVDYEPWNHTSGSKNYNGWFSIWDVDITISNSSFMPLDCVRGICYVESNPENGDFIDLQNADGWTTLWTDYPEIPPSPPEPPQNYKRNPFKAFGTIQGYGEKLESYQLMFKHPNRPDNYRPPIECEYCRHLPEIPPYVDWVGPAPGHAETHLEDFFIKNESSEFEFLFVIDGLIDDVCDDPYTITNFSQSVVEKNPGAMGMFWFNVIDFQRDIEGFSYSATDFEGNPLPGFQVLSTTGTGSGIYTAIFRHGGVNREGIYNLTITVRSRIPLIPQSDPYNNPRETYQIFKLRIGNFQTLLENIFESPINTPGLLVDVKNDWANRDLSTTGLTIVDTKPGYGVGPDYYLLSHQRDYGTHYGVVRVPGKMGGWGAHSLPVMLYTHAGDLVSHVGCTDPFYQDYKNKFIEVIPSYRENYICWGTVPYKSDGINSPANWDVDDVLVFLDEVLNDETFNMADPGRIVVMGGSRGGSPAYLAKIRDSYRPQPKIDGAIIIYGSVTDFFHPSIKRECRRYIFTYPGYFREQEPFNHFEHYFNEDYCVFERIIEPYLRGEFANLYDVRKQMLLSSPFYFSSQDELTRVQVHHGVEDQLARIEQTIKLRDAIGDQVEHQFYTYPNLNPPAHCPDSGSVPSESPETYKQLIEDFLDWIIG